MPWKDEGEEHLGWISQTTRTQTPSPVVPNPEPKDAGVAFFLSLAIPGAGQAYCGEKRRGWWTFFFFVISFVLVIWLWQFLAEESGDKVAVFWGTAFRTALALYAFAFLDAYFTAREKSAGIYDAQPYNPRVAAILNLVTRGFGYWYLDEKNKGVLLFVLIGLAGRASMRISGPLGDGLGILVEVVLAGMAFDAYRLAKKKNQEKMGPVLASPAGLEAASGFQPHIPMALAVVVATAYVGLISIGLLMPDYEKLDQSQAVISAMAEGNLYANAKYGVQLRVPSGWELDNRTDPQAFVDAATADNACSVSVVPSATFPFISADSIGRDLVEQLKQTFPGVQIRETKPSFLAGKPAHEVIVYHEMESGGVDQSFIIARRGLSVYLLIATAAGVSDDPCRAEITQIRERLVLPN